MSPSEPCAKGFVISLCSYWEMMETWRGGTYWKWVRSLGTGLGEDLGPFLLLALYVRHQLSWGSSSVPFCAPIVMLWYSRCPRTREPIDCVLKYLKLWAKIIILFFTFLFFEIGSHYIDRLDLNSLNLGWLQTHNAPPDSVSQRLVL